MGLEFLSDAAFWTGWGSVVLLDLVLAGDNALVIALATRTLPLRQRVWGRVFGTLGAVLVVGWLGEARMRVLQQFAPCLLGWCAARDPARTKSAA